MELTVGPVNTEDTERKSVLEPDDCMLSTKFLNEKLLFEPGTQCLRGGLFKKCRHGTFSARVSLEHPSIKEQDWQKEDQECSLYCSVLLAKLRCVKKWIGTCIWSGLWRRWKDYKWQKLWQWLQALFWNTASGCCYNWNVENVKCQLFSLAVKFYNVL